MSLFASRHTNIVAQLDAFDLAHIQMVERPLRHILPSEVRVRVCAASLNYQDLLVARGHCADTVRLPLIPLSDCAGIVVEIGVEVSRFRKGERVAAAPLPNWVSGPFGTEMIAGSLGLASDGVLAKYFICDQRSLVSIPNGLSFEEAAALPSAGLTAWNALFEKGNLKPGQTVLVQGSGGVSVFALQFATAGGARVIALSGSDSKLERLLRLGAAHVINYREQPDWSRAVLELTGGAGVDHVIEIGGAGTFDKSIRSTCVGGSISIIGALSGASGTLDTVPILKKTLQLQGVIAGSVEMFERMNEMIDALHIRPVIDRTFQMQDIAGALRYLESARHVGKVVVTVPY
jgi:NADPH:quinone reductase-like Zn-dependent oxidoreductase